MARILVADDDRAIRKIVRDRLVAAGHHVDVAEDGRAALASIERFAPDLVLLDLAMPNVDGFGVLAELVPPAPVVVVITAHGDIATAVRAIRAGAWDFVPKPFDPEHLEQAVGRALETCRLRRDVEALRGTIDDRHHLVRGGSRAMRAVMATVERAAASDATILLGGESGTGKEVLARFIHRASPRAVGPFIAVNCAALPGELVESELFGHERGAFTGAVRAKPGKVELAAGGTLFLDEIGELALPAQAKLLRVLQEREVERVGATSPVAVDLRVIAATNRDLEDAVARRGFRADLFYRLNVVAVTVPPLRERRDDIAPLAMHFLARIGRELGRPELRIADDAMEVLRTHAWPGNVRELGNVIERGVALSISDTIGRDDLPEELFETATRGGTVGVTVAAGVGYHDAVVDAKRAILRQALDAEGGHQTRAARRLGLTQPYLARLLKKLEIR
jgi:DNA-binding NtrC family response regulator